MSVAEHPFSMDELFRLFAPLEKETAIIAAVSGGVDSVGLMLTLKKWRDARGELRAPKIIIASIDHGLRKEAENETQKVCMWANGLGFECLRLKGNCGSVQGNLLDHARQLRFALLEQAAIQFDAGMIVLAHHREDQAETFLLQLQRKAGVRGLSAMARLSTRRLVKIFRPFLDQPKSRLVAHVEQAGQSFIRDPTNQDERFHRVKIRKAAAELGALGIGFDVLAQVADQLRKTDNTISELTDQAINHACQIYNVGLVTLNRRKFEELPEEVKLRVAGKLVQFVGGGHWQARSEKLEALVHWVGSENEMGQRTLAGSLLRKRNDKVILMREVGRVRGFDTQAAFKLMDIHGRNFAVVDNRLLVRVQRDFGKRLRYGYLNDLWHRIKKNSETLLAQQAAENNFQGRDFTSLPAACGRALLGVFDDEGQLLCVPQLNLKISPQCPSVEITFLAPGFKVINSVDIT